MTVMVLCQAIPSLCVGLESRRGRVTSLLVLNSTNLTGWRVDKIKERGPYDPIVSPMLV